MLSTEIIDFLKTKEGKQVFRNLTPDLDKRQRDNLKRRLAKPPKNVKEWLQWKSLLEGKYLEKKLKKT